MDFLLSMMSMISPMPKIVVSKTYTPPPQAPREAPFDYTPIVAIGVVTLIGAALLLSNKRR